MRHFQTFTESMKIPVPCAGCLAAVVAGWLWVVPAMPQGHSGKQAHTLPPATVTAPRLTQEVQGGVPAQSLDTAAMRRLGVTDTGDALRRLAGINLRDYGGAGGLKTVSVRGMGAGHTAVVYDGLAVSDLQSGQADIGRFPIERLAGVGLSVAGNDRLLCPVRNLAAATVFLRSLAADTVVRGTHFSGGLVHGSFGTVQPSVRLAASAGRRTALAVAGDFYYGRNDYPFTLKNGILQTRERRANSRIQTWTAEADVLHRTRGGGTWATKAYFYDTHRRLPGQVVLYTSGNSERLSEQTAFAQSRWAQRWRAWEAQAAGKFNWQASRYTDIGGQYPGGALRQHYWQREWYFTGGAAWHGGPWAVAYAADYSFHSLSSNLATSNDVWRHSVQQALSARYATRRVRATVRCIGSIFLNGAAPGQQAAADARRLAPSASLSWLAVEGKRLPARLYARIYYKEYFRVPTFTESYYYHLGSQDLRPELTRQLGAGLTFQAAPARWWPSVRLSLDGYYNRIADRITSVPYNLYVWRTVNMGRVRAGGLDATAGAKFRLAAGHVLIFTANYSFQRAEDRTDPSTRTYGKQPAYMPRHSGAGALAYESRWLGCAVHATAAACRYSSNEHLPATEMPGYVEAGLTLYRSFALAKGRLDARADLINAFDKQYEVVRRYPMPGRAYKLSLTYSW